MRSGPSLTFATAPVFLVPVRDTVRVGVGRQIFGIGLQVLGGP